MESANSTQTQLKSPLAEVEKEPSLKISTHLLRTKLRGGINAALSSLNDVMYIVTLNNPIKIKEIDTNIT